MRATIPPRFKGQNRILFIFKRKAFIYTCIGSAIGIMFLKLFTALEHPIIGLIACAICILPFYLFGNYTYSKDSRYNAGEDLDVVTLRKLRKVLRKVIYVSE